MLNNTASSKFIGKVFFAALLAVSGLTACGGGGGSGEGKVSLVTGGGVATSLVTGGGVAATTTLIATSTSIPYNASTDISWSSTDSNSCTSSGGGGNGPTGSFNTGPLTATTTYTLTCDGPSGKPGKSVTITVDSPNIAAAITGFANAGGGNVTVTAANILTNGDTITIYGTTSYNGTFTVANRTATSFTIVASFVANDATGVWQRAGGLISGCSTTGATGSIVLSDVPSRFTGVAPLSVFFDASGTTDASVTTRPFHDLEYHWNFGEDPIVLANLPGGANWTNGSTKGSRNLATGPVTAHVFETPGTYTVALTATDGTNTVSNSCVQITVQHPDAVFTGSNTVCFSTTGDFTGCPAGATNVTQTDIATAISKYKGTGKRLLFRGQEVFTDSTLSTPGIIDVDGPGMIGSFGIGRAIFRLTAAAPAGTNSYPLLKIGSSTSSVPYISDWRIANIEFDGQSQAASQAIADHYGIMNLLILNCYIHDVMSGIVISADDLTAAVNNKWPNITLYDGIAVVDSTITTVQGLNVGWRIYASATHLSIMGNALGDFISSSGSGSHIVRSHVANPGVISNNTFSRSYQELALKLHGAAWCDSTLSTGSGYTGTCSTVDNTAPPPTTTYLTDLHPMGIYAALSGYTEKVIVSDNKFIGAGSPYLVVAGPQNTNRDERVRDVIFERNWFVFGNNATANAMQLHGSGTTIRNNICDMSNGKDGPNCFGLGLYGSTSPAPPPDGNRIYNNTVYRGTSTTSPNIANPLLATLDNANTNTTIQNNLVYAPLYSSAVIVSGTGASGLVVSNNSSGAQAISSPSFATSTPVNPIDFSIGAGSYALGMGITVPVLSDFFLTSRPQGAGMIDLGAIKGP